MPVTLTVSIGRDRAVVRRATQGTVRWRTAGRVVHVTTQMTAIVRFVGQVVHQATQLTVRQL